MELSLWPNLILIEVLGGEPPMAQTHRRLPRRCRRRTAGGGGETRSRAIHPNFQVNNKEMFQGKSERRCQYLATFFSEKCQKLNLKIILQ